MGNNKKKVVLEKKLKILFSGIKADVTSTVGERKQFFRFVITYVAVLLVQNNSNSNISAEMIVLSIIIPFARARALFSSLKRRRRQIL